MNNTKKTYITKRVKAKEKYFQTQINYWLSLILVVILSIGIVAGIGVWTGDYVLSALAYEPLQTDLNNLNQEDEPIDIEQQIRDIAEEMNFQWTDYLVRLAKCESGLDPLIVNITGNKPVGSRDRGLFQINSYWNHHISDEQAFDLDWSTRWTIDQINKGLQARWMCDKIIRGK